MSNRALLLDLPVRGTRSGRTGSATLKSALSSWTETSTSSTPSGKIDASAKAAVVSASACCDTSISTASVYHLPTASGWSLAWSSSATLTQRGSAGAGDDNGGPVALGLAGAAAEGCGGISRWPPPPSRPPRVVGGGAPRVAGGEAPGADG